MSSLASLVPGPHILWGDALLGSCWNDLARCPWHLQRGPQSPHAPPPKELGTADPDIPAWTRTSLPLPQLVRPEAGALPSRELSLCECFSCWPRRRGSLCVPQMWGLIKAGASLREDLQLFTWLMWEIGD